MNYDDYDRLPLVHFGFWIETLHKWAAEGHLTTEEAENWVDANPVDAVLGEKLGFDCNWAYCFGGRSHSQIGKSDSYSPMTRLWPPIKRRVLEELPDGSQKVLNDDGAIVIEKEGITSIPTEVDHLLKGRKEWEAFFLPRLKFSEERITSGSVNTGEEELPFDKG